MYRRDMRETDRDRLLADMAVAGQVVQAVPKPGGGFAYALEREDRTNLWLAAGDGPPRQLTSEGVLAMRYGRADTRWFDWRPDGERVAYLSPDASVWTVDVADGEKSAVTRHGAPDADPRFSPDGTRLAFVTNYWSPGSLGVVDADGSRLAAVRDDEYVYADPRWADDETLYAVRSRHRDLFDYEAEVVRVTTAGDLEVVFAEQGVRATGARPRPGSDDVAFVTDETGYDVLYLATDDGDRRELLAVDRHDVGAPAWNQAGDRIAATVTGGGDVQVWTATAAGDATQVSETAGRRYAPFWVDGDVYAVVSEPAQPPAVERSATGDVVAGDAFAGFDERLVTPEAVSFEARDGTEVHAMVSLPEGFETADPGSVPLLVHPHGGPTAFDGFEFDFRAQYFAALGYAVIQPNYRGSDGFGRGFRNLNDDAWGDGDLDDVVDAADYLADAHAQVDGERAGIFGGSGGGLMTVNALGRTDRFRAGAAFYGVYDYETFVDDTDDVGWRLLKRELGFPATDIENYRDASPITHVPDVDAPLLVLHGEADERVPVSQSEQLVEALERADKSYEFQRYEGEPHGFERRENVVDAYTRVADLFAKYLQVDPDDGTSRPHPPEDGA